MWTNANRFVLSDHNNMGRAELLKLHCERQQERQGKRGPERLLVVFAGRENEPKHMALGISRTLRAVIIEGVEPFPVRSLHLIFFGEC